MDMQTALPGLTQQQNNLLRLLCAFEEAGEPTPTYDEMRASLGLASKSGIHRLLDALEERGFISRLPNRARAITVNSPPDIAKMPAAILIRELRSRGWRVSQ